MRDVERIRPLIRRGDEIFSLTSYRVGVIKELYVDHAMVRFNPGNKDVRIETTALVEYWMARNGRNLLEGKLDDRL